MGEFAGDVLADGVCGRGLHTITRPEQTVEVAGTGGLRYRSCRACCEDVRAEGQAVSRAVADARHPAAAARDAELAAVLARRVAPGPARGPRPAAARTAPPPDPEPVAAVPVPAVAEPKPPVKRVERAAVTETMRPKVSRAVRARPKDDGHRQAEQTVVALRKGGSSIPRIAELMGMDEPAVRAVLARAKP